MSQQVTHLSIKALLFLDTGFRILAANTNFPHTLNELGRIIGHFRHSLVDGGFVQSDGEGILDLELAQAVQMLVAAVQALVGDLFKIQNP